jgi:hypothetical protein
MEPQGGLSSDSRAPNPANFWSEVCWDGFPDGGSGREQESGKMRPYLFGVGGWGYPKSIYHGQTPGESSQTRLNPSPS